MATLTLAWMTRRRNRIRRLRMRPQITPLRLIHPDELSAEALDIERAV